MKPEIKLALSIEDVNVIISLLRQAPMPWDISDPLLNKIDAQIKKAMEPAPMPKKDDASTGPAIEAPTESEPPK